MRSQKYWLLAGVSIPVLILSLAFARFSTGARPSSASLSSLPSTSSSTRSAPKSSSTFSPNSVSSLPPLPVSDRLCVVDTLQAGAEVRSLEDSDGAAGAVIGKVRPGAQITQVGDIQAKTGQNSKLEVVPISFKRKDLLTDHKSDGENPEALVKAVMWKVVFDQAIQICQ